MNRTQERKRMMNDLLENVRRHRGFGVLVQRVGQGLFTVGLVVWMMGEPMLMAVFMAASLACQIVGPHVENESKEDIKAIKQIMGWS